MMLIIFIIGGLLSTSVDAAITGWTVPSIENAASGSGEIADAIAENKPIGKTEIVIAAISNASLLTYAITDQPTTGLFTIDESGTDIGALSITAMLDFETKKSYIIKVKATDDAGGTGEATVTLNVEDVNEAPVFTDASVTLCVQQGTTGGTSITTVKASDPEGENVTYTLKGTVTDFVINPSSGVVAVAEAATLSQENYELDVAATDGSFGVVMKLILSVGECSGVSNLISSLNLLTILTFLAVSIN